MPRYLSPEWLASLGTAVARNEQLQNAVRDTKLVVGQVVTGTPDGDVRYSFVFDHGDVRVSSIADGGATVTFTQDYATAAAIARGDLSAQEAFMTGRIRVTGDIAELIAHQGALTAVDDVLGHLRAATEF